MKKVVEFRPDGTYVTGIGFYNHKLDFEKLGLTMELKYFKYRSVLLGAALLSGCVSPQPPRTDLNLNRVQIRDSELSCDQIKDEIDKLDTISAQNNVASEQNAAMAAGQMAMNAVASSPASSVILSSVPMLGSALSVAAMVVGNNGSNQTQIDDVQIQTKVQARKEYLAELFINNHCNSRANKDEKETFNKRRLHRKTYAE